MAIQGVDAVDVVREFHRGPGAQAGAWRVVVRVVPALPRVVHRPAGEPVGLRQAGLPAAPAIGLGAAARLQQQRVVGALEVHRAAPGGGRRPVEPSGRFRRVDAEQARALRPMHRRGGLDAPAQRIVVALQQQREAALLQAQLDATGAEPAHAQHAVLVQAQAVAAEGDLGARPGGAAQAIALAHRRAALGAQLVRAEVAVSAALQPQRAVHPQHPGDRAVGVAAAGHGGRRQQQGRPEDQGGRHRPVQDSIHRVLHRSPVTNGRSARSDDPRLARPPCAVGARAWNMSPFHVSIRKPFLSLLVAVAGHISHFSATGSGTDLVPGAGTYS